MADKKKCIWCKKSLGAAKFTKDRSRPDGLSSRCKDCQRLPAGERPPARLKKVNIVSIKVTDDERGSLEADAARYALRQLVQKHAVEFEHLKTSYVASNGKHPLARIR